MTTAATRRLANSSCFAVPPDLRLSAFICVLFFLLLGVAQAALAAQPVRARHGMVATGEENATNVGVAVLQSGGNAVDAAVAVGFALGVTHYPMCGLGGGGHVIIRMADGRITVLDFREQAPGKATRDMFLDANGNLSPDSTVGWRAAAVPGTVRGLETAHKKYGRKPWAELLKPAIELAARGHALSWGRADMLKNETKLRGFPETRRIFLKGGEFFEPGERLVQPELAETLHRIARDGARDFYEGETARRLAAASAANGGLITLADLKGYNVSERQPLEANYRGYHIITMPPSSAGGVALLQMLGILEGSGYEKEGAGSAAAIHFMTEAMRRVYADRSQYFGDPDFVKIPVAGLLDKAYLARLRQSIDPRHATPSDSVRPGVIADGIAGRGVRNAEYRTAIPLESAETTHFSIVDGDGNAVALTYTLNARYGSGVVVPGLGFFLNDNMDNFAARPGHTNQYGLVQQESNAIAPRRRPVSSMTPVIVLRDGKLYFVAGTPGGTTIPNTMLQIVVNILDFGMNVQEALNRPRFHHQWLPDILYLEAEAGISPDTVRPLKERGHNIEFKLSNNDVNAILADGGWLQGAVDPRREARVAGY